MGDTRDFDAIVREHGPMIARIAASHEADRHRAEELTQDILLAVWQALPSFRGESLLKTFIARIATNRSISHIARAVKMPATALDEAFPSPHDGPEALAIADDSRSKLSAAVRRLPIAYREAATLTLEGFSPAEIADLLGVSANTVSIRLTRAKESLRAFLGEKP